MLRCLMLVPLLLLLAGHAVAKPYEITWRLSFKAGSETATGSLELGAGSEQLRSIDFSVPEMYESMEGNGTLKRSAGRLLWTPPHRGGRLSWRVRIDQQRANGTYRAYFPGDWAIFRGDHVFPNGSVRSDPGAQSRARLVLELPKGWHLDTPYLRGSDGSYIIDDPDRRFNRPVGWMMVGKIGTRREQILNTEVAISAPTGIAMRRMDMLAQIHYAMPSMQEAFGSLPEKILIVSAPDPMWRGGLSAPRSLYLHSDRPLISENGTSTLLHELTHVVTRIRGKGDNDDWIAEGLAEYYAVELLHRSGGSSDARREHSFRWMANWGKDVRSLRAKRSSGPATARAAVLLRELDRELRQRSKDRHNLDDLVRRLMPQRAVSTAEFIAAAEALAGGKLKTLDTPLLRR